MIADPALDPPVVAVQGQPTEAVATAAESIPVGVRQMIEAAIATGDAKAVETVLRLARSTQPAAGQALDRLERQWKQEQAARAAIAETRHKPWRTQIELGASRSTGRTSQFGMLGSLSVERETDRWRHKGQARFEIQRGRNVVPVDRGSLSWQPGYKFGEQLYLHAQAQVETDPLQGFDARHTAGGGLGLKVLKRASAEVEVEGGPAVRHTQSVRGGGTTSLSARAAINLRVALLPTLELGQANSLYLEDGNRSAAALTSVDARLIGPVRARLSYDVRYESRLASRSHIETLSRATLVVSF